MVIQLSPSNDGCDVEVKESVYANDTLGPSPLWLPLRAKFHWTKIGNIARKHTVSSAIPTLDRRLDARKV